MPDAIGTLGLDIKPFEDALDTVNTEMADLIVESKKLNAEIALLQRQMFLAGGGTKKQAQELKALTAVSEDFTEQIKRAKEEQKAFQEVVDQSSPKLEEAARSGFKLSNALGSIGKNILMAVGIGSIVEIGIKIHHAYEEAHKLNDEIAKIGKDTGNPEFRSLTYFENRINRINESLEKLQKIPGTLDATSSIFAQLAEDPAKYLKEFALRGIPGAGNAAANDIAKRQDSQQLSLLNEKKLAEENEREFRRIQGEKSNEAALDKARHDDLEKQIRDGNKIYLDDLEKKKAAKEAAAKSERELDADLAMAKKKDLQKQVEDGNKLYLDDLEKKKKLKEIAKKNFREIQDAQIQTEVGRLQNTGHGLAANELAIKQRFEERKRAANAAGNPDLVAELEKQEKQALQGTKASEARQTTGDVRRQEQAARRDERDAARLDRRRDELNERAQRDIDPATGKPRTGRSKAIDAELKRRSTEKAQQDATKDRKDNPAEKAGYNSTDRAYLKACADGLKVKD